MTAPEMLASLRRMNPEKELSLNERGTAIAVKTDGRWEAVVAVLITGEWAAAPAVLIDGQRPDYGRWRAEAVESATEAQ